MAQPTLLNRHSCCWILLLIITTISYSNAQDPSQKIVSRFIIIGDPGKLQNGRNAVVDAASKYISPTDKKTTVLFLGDNIYPKGLPDEEDKTYQASATVLRTILSSFKDLEANVYVVPGNHDWQKGGPDGWQSIKRQEQFVKDLHQSNTFFLPSAGCPGPQEIIMNDSLMMIIMDTQWWLHVYDKPGIDNDCDCKTEEDVMSRLRDIVFRNPRKRILFAAHHPLRSYGEHGGYYTLKQHIFPLTDLSKNAYVPLPVIGSLYPIVRGKFGNVEDLMHPVYRDLIERD
ncbi:MAG: metallophosphoesterase [Bacteroidota bacterium]